MSGRRVYVLERRQRLELPVQRTFEFYAQARNLTVITPPSGKPYTVFSAFRRSWEREGRREVLGAPRQLPALPSGLARGEIPSLASLGLEQEVDEPPKGGEHEGRKRP